MFKVTDKMIRALSIRLLDDIDGINSRAFAVLLGILGGTNNCDIVTEIEAFQSDRGPRFRLNPGHGFVEPDYLTFT